MLLICLLPVTTAKNVRAASPHAGPAVEAFRDSVDSPPARWKGPRFKLSHAYPKQKPVCEAPWLKRHVSFSDANSTWNDWRGYVQDIIDYVKQGQNPNLPDETGWQTTVDGRTLWFHVPWMAYDGQRGREFVHAGVLKQAADIAGQVVGEAVAVDRQDERAQRERRKPRLLARSLHRAYCLRKTSSTPPIKVRPGMSTPRIS